MIFRGLLVAMVLATRVGAEPAPQVDLSKSAPVEINGLSFVVATQKQWGRGDLKPVIQLLVTNISKDDITFPVFDTLGINGSTWWGFPIVLGGFRTITDVLPPVLLHPGETQNVAGFIEVKWTKPTFFGTPQLTGYYFDGTGTSWNFSTLTPGRYYLSFGVSSRTTKDPFPVMFAKPHGPLWLGEGTTKSAPFDVVSP